MISDFSLRSSWLLALSICCWASAASADQAGSAAEMRTVARDLAQQGAEAFEHADYVVALDRFSRAQAVFKAPSLSLMRARSLRNLGRLVEALDAYEETQRATVLAGAPDVYRRAVEEARREAAELAARVPRLLIRTRGAQPASVRVVMDGEAVPRALLDVERPIDPGQHEIRAVAPGKEPVIRRVVVNEQERSVVELRFDEPASAQRALRHPVSATSLESGPSGSASFRRTGGWVGIGVGTAALVTATITGIIALQKQSSLNSVCRPACPSSAADDIDAFRTNRTLSYGGFALGAASLGVGAYLLLTGSPQGNSVGLRVSPSGLKVGGRF